MRYSGASFSQTCPRWSDRRVSVRIIHFYFLAISDMLKLQQDFLKHVG